MWQRIEVSRKNCPFRKLPKWKSSNLHIHVTCMHLRPPNQWKLLQKPQHGVGRHVADQPPPNDFQDMLENLFFQRASEQSISTTSTYGSGSELTGIEARNQADEGKQIASDECGLVAELLHFAPENVSSTILCIMNSILRNGEIPCAWRKTLCQMLPKTRQSKVTTDFRPIANIRRMYKIFAYLLLGCIEARTVGTLAG